MATSGTMHTAQTEDDLPYLTARVRGVGCVLRRQPEDFQVEEMPLYLPAGRGEHLYARVTKRGLSTPDLVTTMASILGVKGRCIGVAGLKDARAVTTQLVSVQGIDPEALNRLDRDPRILSVEVLGRHGNRLRTGHHAGNRFRIVIRDIHAGAAAGVTEILDEVSRRGMPNYFGPQRQGRKGVNYRTGAALLRDPRRRNRMPRAQRMWFLHAYQSFLFNKVLSARIDRLDRMLAGDWAMKHTNGACFVVEDAEVEQVRAEAFEISPTGPLFGSRAPWASGEPGALERAAAAEVEETPESLREAASACGFRGERRALRAKPHDLDWRIDGDALTLSFVLPPGAYATSLLREIMKPEAASDAQRAPEEPA
jgi:tRNA pseudouridine13 synthase